MNKKTREKLIDLNRQFYQTFAEEFSATRQRLQPGVMRIVDQISIRDSILDLGCGNGQVGKLLFSRGHKGFYTGLDANADLLKIARANLPGRKQVSLVQGDLTSSTWNSDLPARKFDIVFAFAVLHHIPGSELRKQILSTISDLITPGTHFIHSVWQFLNSPRLKSRIQPWENIGVKTADLDNGDYLIDWRAGGHGLRYIHVFSEQELETLAAENGFNILESFYSDGEGGKLGLYQIWERL